MRKIEKLDLPLIDKSPENEFEYTYGCHSDSHGYKWRVGSREVIIEPKHQSNNENINNIMNDDKVDAARSMPSDICGSDKKHQKPTSDRGN